MSMNKGLMKNLTILLLSFIYLNVSAAHVKTTVKTNPAPVASASNPIPQADTPATASIIPSAPAVDAKGYILMDANTGIVFASKEIDTRMAPASLTKLMTLYQIASALKDHRINLNDKIPISEKAWRTGGSKMFVKIGDQVPLSDLIQGIAVVSGNDACVAVAEQLAGTEDSFAELMNHSAQLLGMVNTHFTDATGLPNPNHYTSPRDLALLTRALITQFPEYYHWYSQKEFFYNGIKQPNRDVLLWRDPSIEGMKTGHTDDAGYCLVSTASRNGMRLIAVVMGSSSTRNRADASLALLNYGFRFYESKKLFAANTPVEQPRVWFGKTKTISLGSLSNIYATVPTGQLDKIKMDIVVDKNIKAPIVKGTQLGTINVMLNDKIYHSQPLIALQDDPKGGFFTRTKDQLLFYIHKLLHPKS
jgi:D-alanyl-D-alanine carboxypeptidase (penicillin-binding protein 5/6)